jgi:hypothetical protein
MAEGISDVDAGSLRLASGIGKMQLSFSRLRREICTHAEFDTM